jgi:hypothetical protein
LVAAPVGYCPGLWRFLSRTIDIFPARLNDYQNYASGVANIHDIEHGKHHPYSNSMRRSLRAALGFWIAEDLGSSSGNLPSDPALLADRCGCRARQPVGGAGCRGLSVCRWAGHALRRFPGPRAVIVVLNALMGLPPCVVGLAFYLLLSRSGPLGMRRICSRRRR